MSTKEAIRVACVGAGYFSKFHYESWSRMPGAVPVASCNRDIKKARETGLAAYDDLSKMLEAEEPDLVDIILPPVAQAEAIRAALRFGIKWLICQKPFCLSLGEAEEVVSEADEVGATIVVHENFRFQPWYRAIKEAMAEGRIGTPLQATFRLRPGDGQGPRAYLDRQPYFQDMPRFLVHETAVHWVDTFRFLFGAPSAVYADLRRVNPVIVGEDAGYILFDHPNGLKALFDGNRCLDHSAENLRQTMGEALIEGTIGSLVLNGDGSVELRAFGKQERQQILPPSDHDGFGGGCVHALQSHVVSGLLRGTPLENTAREYLDVIRIEEKIYLSAAEGRKINLETP
ncbi:Gfo/Idh/MocA family protein [Ruegeria atlantica]|uniref:Gfo/Idh/MocA family oxidoreductase n=1 Tax=Ruegeria atlantica TaxID=81569 RepID=A0ABX1WF32_9RHOB|nr:Gfo/Idh/MocA family oxidoreductase [Ruegeria atlantica]NOD31924.1 Gfo/Idh/MocA family oxidoreductase [Ruegeria atlantica]